MTKRESGSGQSNAPGDQEHASPKARLAERKVGVSATEGLEGDGGVTYLHGCINWV